LVLFSFGVIVLITKRSFKVSLACRHCGKESAYVLKIPLAKLKSVKVDCLKCGYSWDYRGRLERRIECSKCGSTQNEVSRKVFGSYKKEV